MEQLIPIINKLMDVYTSVGHGNSLELNLPQIAVVGSQSAGKSSVLENLVGRDFLPRGAGIVTRRPLVLQMINLPGRPDGSTDKLEWGEFLHLPQRFYDFAQIRRQIEKDTEQVTGGAASKKISDQPIHLKIYSPHVLNLTLVDLPGLTKVPVHDQPDDIEHQIEALIMKYIQPSNTIILAVTAANTDVANSDALKFARRVDPQGERTIGVLTKLDLMDAGTDAVDVLTGRVVPLRLGFIGVVNRSQQDIANNLPIREALDKEKRFFEEHPVYSSYTRQLGTENLARSLSSILVKHVHNCLPELRARVSAMYAAATQGLAALGESVSNEMDQGALILRLLTQFSSQYCATIDGTTGAMWSLELSGGARICDIFHDHFAKEIGRMDPLHDLTEMDIHIAIKNAAGVRPALIVPEVSFEILVRRQIERLLFPSQKCLDSVYEEMQRLVPICSTPELRKYTRLWEAVQEIVYETLKVHFEPTAQMIKDVISMELALVNTSHPDFVGGQRAVEMLVTEARDGMGDGDHRGAYAPTPASVPDNKPRIPSIDDYQPEFGVFNPMAGDPMRDAFAEYQGQKPGQQSAGFFGRIFGRGHTPQSQEDERASIEIASIPDSTPASEPLSQRQLMETQLIQSLIRSYFSVVAKHVQDRIPKAIMLLLVNKVKEGLQSRLVGRLYRHDQFEALLLENPQVAYERKEIKEQLAVLDRAQRVLKEIREANV